MELRRCTMRPEASCSGRGAGMQSSAAFAGRQISASTGQRRMSSRGALRIECKESRIGKQPVKVADGITVTLKPGSITCKGQKGEMSQAYDDSLVEITESEEKGTYLVKKRVESKEANQTHGLVRALFSNMTEGLAEGFTKTLSLQGVGYRAIGEAKQLSLNLGYSNMVVMPLPEGIEVKVERATTVHITGYDKHAVGAFAANVRAKRPPEPYKGKGVRYIDEFVRKKDGKRGKK